MLSFALRQCKLMRNFYHSTVKHVTQNIQNDCHQWLSDSFTVHQIRVRAGLRPGPRRGKLTALLQAQAGLRDLLLRGRGGDGEGKREGRLAHPYTNSWIRP